MAARDRGRQTDILNKIYFNPKGAASFSNSETLFREAKRRDPSITRANVKKFLSQNYTSLLHKEPKLRNRPTVPNVTTGINLAWDCDLLVMRGVRSPYGLICVDKFSSKIFFKPIANKFAKTVTVALENIIKTQNNGVYPRNIRTDQVCLLSECVVF